MLLYSTGYRILLSIQSYLSLLWRLFVDKCSCLYVKLCDTCHRLARLWHASTTLCSERRIYYQKSSSGQRVTCTDRSVILTLKFVPSGYPVTCINPTLLEPARQDPNIRLETLSPSLELECHPLSSICKSTPGSMNTATVSSALNWIQIGGDSDNSRCTINAQVWTDDVYLWLK